MVLIGLLIPFVAWAQASLGRNVSPTVATHEDHELVTDGPYHWIRHPLYTAGVLLFFGLGLLAASWVMILAAPAALAMISVRLPAEEAELERRFGQAYRDYRQRTGRFFPRLGS